MKNQELFYSRLRKDLSSRRENNLYRETRTVSESLIDLSSNDYLQLRTHPAVIEGARIATESYGAGSGASPLLTGFKPCHEALLNKILVWKNKKFGMLFNTGFMANQAIFTHLPQKNDLILADRLIHHSIAQTLARSPVRFKRYPHLDLHHLERELGKAQYDTVFVVTESIFSMDGDYPDLKHLASLKEKYNFIWILDEAHGVGVYGETGAGLAEEMGVGSMVDVVVGTLGKALGSMGAYVISDHQEIIEYLTNTSGEYIFSTFLCPSAVGAAHSAIDCVIEDKEKRHLLRENAIVLRQELTRMGYNLIDSDSQIVPIILGDAGLALKMSDYFYQEGIRIGAIRFPTVPKGKERLRLSLHSGISAEQISIILKLFQQWKSKI
ncbi:MAG: hypothetical protein COV66_13915 [Nitrospinae bacterium CG11_big_fil_rev_8_21_14_0_20_45_15]|nr:MAG: hypothetical protein COV66_13915 [Nitrospinae bacterium CG11_big_fil_rev_8_21_14_0_20_45_15]